MTLIVRVRHLLEMIRFSHTIFALPFAMLAAVMAWNTPAPAGLLKPEFAWPHWFGILFCMIGARSAAMAFNRLADHRLDALNPRTQGRHLPAGLLTVGTVVAFTLIAAAIFFAGTLLFLPNKLPLILSTPVLLFLFAYSYTKRFTSLAHFWLGAALMLAPICAWIALRGEIVLAQPLDLLPAALLGTAVLLWVAGFDIIYACQDYAYDVQARLRSVPAQWGVAGALRIAAGCHLAMVVVLFALPQACPQLGLGWLYHLGIAGVALLLVYEHWIVRPDDLSRVNAAFYNVNAIVSVGLLVIGAIDLLTS
jgi:4-hydroxybenzoate polyprenyltransferase